VTSILDLDELLNRTVDIFCDTYGYLLRGSTSSWTIPKSGLCMQAGRGEAGQRCYGGHKLKVNGFP
jgi:hypothetical protein